MQLIKHAIVVAMGVSFVFSYFDSTVTLANDESVEEVEEPADIAPVWDDTIRQWAPEIVENAADFGLDPDLVAAVILVESNGYSGVVSYAGAVGLMGIMPQGPGFEFRPNATELYDPKTNINWGSAILADILQQAGGDLHAALAAYNGGWQYANWEVPRNYAKRVTHEYGRAIASRVGINPNDAKLWTVAVENRTGYISAEPLLLGGHRLLGKTPKIGEHIIYDGVSKLGKSYLVRGYAVPVSRNINFPTIKDTIEY